MTEWAKQRKITRFPGAGADPVVFIAQLYEMAQAGKIKTIAASIEWDDETFADAHMRMSKSKLLFHAHVLMDKAHKGAMAGDE